MARIYRVTFEAVTVSAAQDLVQITGATGKIMKILRAWVKNVTTSLPAAQGIAVRGRYLPATVTVGSGGTTGITPSKLDAGDAACSSSTCAINNTTKATTSATAVVVMEDGGHIYQGVNHVFDNPPVVGPTDAFVFELLSTVSGTVTLSGGVELSEEGGAA